MKELYKEVNNNAKKLMESLEKLDKAGEYHNMIRVQDDTGMSMNQLPTIFTITKMIEITDKILKEM